MAQGSDLDDGISKLMDNIRKLAGKNPAGALSILESLENLKKIKSLEK